MRRSNARRRKVKKRVKFSKLYNSLSRERYALVTLCQLVPSSNDRSYVFTIRRRRARVKGDTLWRRTRGATEENRKKRVVLPVFKRMEGKVNTCRSFDPDLEREGGGKKEEEEKEREEKKVFEYIVVCNTSSATNVSRMERPFPPSPSLVPSFDALFGPPRWSSTIPQRREAAEKRNEARAQIQGEGEGGGGKRGRTPGFPGVVFPAKLHANSQDE